MYSNHDEHANHADRAGRDAVPAETQPFAGAGAPDPVGNSFRSQTNPATVGWLDALARNLAALRAVLDEELNARVTGRGACMAPDPSSQPWHEGSGTGEDSLQDFDAPPGLFDPASDQELARRVCAGCPVADACTELELRQAGPDTVGVWGGLDETHRRALYPLWRRHRERPEPPGPTDDAGTDAGAGVEGGGR